VSSLAINRERKAAAIVAVLDRTFREIGVDPERAADHVRSMPELDWRMAALIAGKDAPSAETRALVLATYEGRERFVTENPELAGVGNG